MADSTEPVKKKTKTSELHSNLASVQTDPPKMQFYRRVLPDKCIGFSSDEGKQIFKEALATGYMECYFNLAAQFRTQDEPAFCGLSTLVMVLNALEVDPKRLWKGVWRWYHEYMLDCCVPIKVVEAEGVTLDQMACLAACNTLNVSVTRGSPPHTEDEFRNAVKSITQTSDKVMILSYDRSTLDQTGTGHFSPLGGYHEEKDLALVLDVARFKYPPYWVSIPLLWKAMQVPDPNTGQPRGYMTVSKSASTPLVIFRISPLLSINLAAPDKPVSDELSTFLEKWNDWQAETDQSVDKTNVQTSQLDNAILQEAVIMLVRALRELQSDSLLTTQIDVKCKLSNEHTCAVETVVDELEDSVLYKTVQSHLISYPELSTTNAGMMSSAVLFESCDDRNSTSTETDSSFYSKCKECNFQLNLQVPHFLSMILLSWPYTKCAPNSKGGRMSKMSSRQVINTGVLLQNEVTLLRQQLRLLLGLINTCEC